MKHQRQVPEPRRIVWMRLRLGERLCDGLARDGRVAVYRNRGKLLSLQPSERNEREPDGQTGNDGPRKPHQPRIHERWEGRGPLYGRTPAETESPRRRCVLRPAAGSLQPVLS